MPIRFTQVTIGDMVRRMLDYPRTLLEFQYLFPDETACARHLERIRSVLKIAARVESMTYRDFYEGAKTRTNLAEPDEPVSTG